MKRALFLASFIFFIIAIWLLIFYFQEKGFIPNQKNPFNQEEQTSLEKKYNELTLEQKVGQIFMIGIEGKEMTEATERLVRELHPGAILLLGKNIGTKEELRNFTDSLQRIALEDAGLPLFIAVDQEGGPVSRISWVERTPQSEIKTEAQAYNIGKQRGEELRELGINLNLAPLLDSVFPKDFIYERGFIKDNGILGNKIVEGQRDGGILSCIKHFPGYGNIFFHPEDNLAYTDKLPESSQFKEVENPDLIMVSNVVYRELKEDFPFSFLKEGVDLLKKGVEGDYLIMSDDLSQYSLLNNFSLREVVSKPISAGINILIFSGWRSPVEEGILEAIKSVKEGYVEEAKVDESVLKIIKLKQKYFNLF